MITVVGSINLDIIGTVGRLPRPGETVMGTGFATAPGGKGANQALAARRAGADVRMVGAVGDDDFAAQALALLREGGVDLAHVRTVSDGATGIALILVDASGENVIAVISGANMAVTEADAEDFPLREGDHVLFQMEVPAMTTAHAIRRARDAGATSILNTAPFTADAPGLAEQADIVIANETEFALLSEALALSGGSEEDRMRDFADRTGRTIVVTFGAAGVVAARGDGLWRIPAPEIEPVDTVGAGDTFCGALGAGLDAGHSLDHALELAVAAASLACLKPGAQPAIPSLREVEDFRRTFR